MGTNGPSSLGYEFTSLEEISQALLWGIRATIGGLRVAREPDELDDRNHRRMARREAREKRQRQKVRNQHASQSEKKKKGRVTGVTAKDFSGAPPQAMAQPGQGGNKNGKNRGKTQSFVRQQQPTFTQSSNVRTANNSPSSTTTSKNNGSSSCEFCPGGHERNRCPVYGMVKKMAEAKGRRFTPDLLRKVVGACNHVSATPSSSTPALPISAFPEQQYRLSALLSSGDVLDPLIDTGADFSIINKDLVKRLNLKITHVDDDTLIQLADKSKVKRIGYVTIVLSFIKHGIKQQEKVRMKKRFEIMDCNQSMILGVDVIPTLFPNDEIKHYIIQPANITTKPQKVTYRICNTRPSLSSVRQLPTGEKYERRISFHDTSAAAAANAPPSSSDDDDDDEIINVDSD
jgi:hypothetical protein